MTDLIGFLSFLMAQPILFVAIILLAALMLFNVIAAIRDERIYAARLHRIAQNKR